MQLTAAAPHKCLQLLSVLFLSVPGALVFFLAVNIMRVLAPDFIFRDGFISFASTKSGLVLKTLLSPGLPIFATVTEMSSSLRMLKKKLETTGTWKFAEKVKSVEDIEYLFSFSTVKVGRLLKQI